jgi:hypothetical protein
MASPGLLFVPRCQFVARSRERLPTRPAVEPALRAAIARALPIVLLPLIPFGMSAVMTAFSDHETGEQRYDSLWAGFESGCPFGLATAVLLAWPFTSGSAHSRAEISSPPGVLAAVLGSEAFQEVGLPAQ